MKRTPAIEILDKANIRYELHEFSATEYTAAEAAEKLQINIEAVFKTLLIFGEKHGRALAVVPGNKELNLKKLASALGEKKADLAKLGDIQRITGYLKGGVSPLGSKQVLPVLIDHSSLEQEIISVSAGLRGLQIFIKPSDLISIAKAQVAELC